MDKFRTYKPSEETIESWLGDFEARFLCHNIETCNRKRRWCQALVGDTGRFIIKNLPQAATWEEIKLELTQILGEAFPEDVAFESLFDYKTNNKHIGEIATNIMNKANRANLDGNIEHRLGLRAFIAAVPCNIRGELIKKRFSTVREALEEAKFFAIS